MKQKKEEEEEEKASYALAPICTYTPHSIL